MPVLMGEPYSSNIIATRVVALAECTSHVGLVGPTVG